MWKYAMILMHFRYIIFYVFDHSFQINKMHPSLSTSTQLIPWLIMEENYSFLLKW